MQFTLESNFKTGQFFEQLLFSHVIDLAATLHGFTYDSVEVHDY